MSIYLKATISLCLFACYLLVVSANDGGWSDTYRKQDNWGKYSFGYKIVDKHGAKQSREEHGDPWTKVGRYSLQDVDGRQRFVSYVADKGGFRAKIDTNEPGTGNVDAANAIYNGPDHHGYSETHVPSGDGGHHAHSEPHAEPHGHHEEEHGHNEVGEHDGYAASTYDGKNVQHVYHAQAHHPSAELHPGQHQPTELHQVHYLPQEADAEQAAYKK